MANGGCRENARKLQAARLFNSGLIEERCEAFACMTPGYDEAADDAEGLIAGACNGICVAIRQLAETLMLAKPGGSDNVLIRAADDEMQCCIVQLFFPVFVRVETLRARLPGGGS